MSYQWIVIWMFLKHVHDWDIKINFKASCLIPSGILVLVEQISSEGLRVKKTALLGQTEEWDSPIGWKKSSTTWSGCIILASTNFGFSSARKKVLWALTKVVLKRIQAVVAALIVLGLLASGHSNAWWLWGPVVHCLTHTIVSHPKIENWLHLTIRKRDFCPNFPERPGSGVTSGDSVLSSPSD